MSFIDKKSASIIREFVNKTRQLSLVDLSSFLNNEEYLKIKGFSKELHLDLVFDVIMEDRGFNLKDLMNQDDSDKKGESSDHKNLRVKHCITLVFTEPSLQLINPNISRIPFSYGSKISELIDNHLLDENFDELIYQSNGVIETIHGDTHLIDHVYYVFVSDLKKLESFLSLKKMKSIDKNIWLTHISKLSVLSFDKKYIVQLDDKKKQIENK